MGRRQLRQGFDLTFQQPIAYLTIDPYPIDSGFTIEENLKIGNRPEAGAQIASMLASAAGTLDTYQLTHSPTFAYALSSWAEGAIDEADAEAKLRIFVTKIQHLMLGLWLVKDNSANPLKAYLRVDGASGPYYMGFGFANQFHTADADLRPTHFSNTEFEQGVEFYRQLSAVIPQRPESESRATGLVLGGRLSRTIYLIQAARTAPDLLIRIAFSCVCLEALFSTDTSGIAHRISERTAMFLGTTGPDRRAIYSDIHQLYRTRSAVLHGSSVKESKVPLLSALTRRCDDYLRRCITKILCDPLLLDLFERRPAGRVDAYFLDHLFPV